MSVRDIAAAALIYIWYPHVFKHYTFARWYNMVITGDMK